MKLICAWCQALIRDGTLPASHGICEGCKKILLHSENVIREAKP